jgi:3-methyladenine DNA glycosylase AlkD
VRSFPDRMVPLMEEWVHDDDMWIRRTALLHQLRFGADTDAARLFRHCELRMHEDDFFIRKAIGWALRTYARHKADAVHSFVDKHRDALSPLSVREALKHIGESEPSDDGSLAPDSQHSPRKRPRDARGHKDGAAQL